MKKKRNNPYHIYKCIDIKYFIPAPEVEKQNQGSKSYPGILYFGSI